MSVGNLLQGNAGLEGRRVVLVGFHRSHEAPALVLGLEHLTTFLEIGIQLRKLLPEVINAALEIAVGYEEMLLHILLFHLIAGLTCKDHQLTDYIRTTEVDTRVGFRVTLFFGAAHCFREGHVSCNLVEDEVQRTREDRLDLQDLITRVTQVVDRTDNRQSGTHVGLITEPYTTVASRLAQLDIAVIVAGSSNLVGCNN